MKYYGLLSGLPTLRIKKPLPLPVADLRSLLTQYTSGREAQIAHHFFYQWDLTNYNALVQNKDWWLDGGNMDKAEIQNWYQKDFAPNSPFSEQEPNALGEKKSDIARLQDHWERFYESLSALSGGQLNAFIVSEKTLKNFFKGYMERKIEAKAGIHFLSGGIFNRFSYNKLMITDIQAEYPQLAQLLSYFDEPDPFVREGKMLEIKWNYYDYLAFFNPFGLEGLFAYLLKYLDVAKWSANNRERGSTYLENFEKQILNQIPTAS